MGAGAFAAARVEPVSDRTRCLSPSFLALIGRALCRRGELVCDVDVIDGRIELTPAGWHYVYGGPRPSDWVYHLEAQGPTNTTHRYRPRDGVAHFMYAVDPAFCWRGQGPLQVAVEAGRLSGNLEKSLSPPLATARARSTPGRTEPPPAAAPPD